MTNTTNTPAPRIELPPLDDRASYSAEHIRSLISAAIEADRKRAAPVAAQPLIARPLAEWHEDDGPVMWWAWCGRAWAGEPAWCGTPNDSDWPGYHTHWTPHPAMPAAEGVQA